MKVKMSLRVLLSILLTAGLLAAVWAVHTALAEGPDSGTTVIPKGGFSPNYTFTYQGRLLEGGQPATGYYDFLVTLWPAESVGPKVADCTDTENPLNNHYVEDGIFTFRLQPAPFNGEFRWIQVEVRPHDPTDTEPYTTLPRQPITASPYAWSLYPGADISGDVSTPSAAINVVQTEDTMSTDAFGIYGRAPEVAIYGEGSGGNGTGVMGYGSYRGVYGVSGVRGVYGDGDSVSGTGVYGTGGGYGVDGWSYSGIGVHGASWTGEGVRGESSSGVGVMARSAHGDLIAAYDTSPSSELVFHVENDGRVESDVGFYTPASDFAEMLPAVEGLEPGDVLVIGADGQLICSSTAYDTSVVGVYSTKPGFVGGSDEEGDNSGKVPVAVLGVVPVKVSAENGAIAPGDLLTSSATAGHAMRAGADPPVGTVIGKALEPLAEGTGLIQMLVVLQ